MIGWDIRVIRGGSVKRPLEYPAKMVEGGETIHYIPPTSINHLEHTPIELAQSAVDILCVHGYPFLFSIKAGDLPYNLDASDDEVVYVEAWDQS